MNFKFSHLTKKSKGFSTNFPSIGEELSTSKQGDFTVMDAMSDDSDTPMVDEEY